MTPDGIHMWEQRLQAISHECAEAFCLVRSPMVQALAGAAFERWIGQAFAMAQAGWRGWECAVWYLKLSPQLLTRLSVEGLIALTEPTRRLMVVAPRLGIEFLRATACFLERDRCISLQDWAAAGERLIAFGRSGRLAAAYFEESPAILSLTGAAEFQEWLALVQTLGAVAEATALEVVRHSAQHLEKVPALARLKALCLLHAVARQTLPLAGDVWTTLTSALHAPPEHLCDPLLDLALGVAGIAPQYVDRLLKAIARSFPGIPPAEQAFVLRQCLQVGRADAEAVTVLCEHLSDVLRQLAVPDLEVWAARGLAVLRDNRDAGLAYFALESQACQAQLAVLSRVVYLRDVQGVLRLYASALAGRPLSVRPLAELPSIFQSRLRRFPTTDGETIYLPASAEPFASSRDNFRLYRVMTAHQAGYIEFGTFDFALNGLVRRLDSAGAFEESARWSTAVPPQTAPLRSAFERFFAAFPRPSLARDLFYCLEDGRIDYRLCQAYRGLAPQIEQIIGDSLALRPSLAGRPLWEAVIEVLIHLCSGGALRTQLSPVMVPLARFLRGVAARVRQPQATVYESAIGTLAVYRLLERLPNAHMAAFDDLSVDGEILALADALAGEAALEAFSHMMPALPAGDEVAYQSPEPLLHQGDLQPDLVQRKLKVKELSEQLEQAARAAAPIPAELLRELLEQGVDIDIRSTVAQELDETSGLFVSDLEGKDLPQRMAPSSRQTLVDHDRLRERLSEELKGLEGGEIVYRYDEWDYLLHDYRVQWCHLREKAVAGEEEGFVAKVLEADAALIRQLRRQFQLLKPELFKKLKRRDHGEEIDIDAAIEAVVDRRVTGTAPERIYIKRNKREREVSTIFLLDLSASTDDPIEPRAMAAPVVGHQAPRGPRSGVSGRVHDDGFYAPLSAPALQQPQGKRIIDVEKEALIVMAEALESIGDEYAIYGFSGYGREQVEFFVVKDVEERYAEAVKRRIDALKPHRSTRMGPPIRHATQKLQCRSARLKTLIMLSDGYPQDFDYGKDRRSKDYGIQDTKVALQEARRKGIHTFCITVDREGKAYLPEMCGAEHFVVIENVARLPQLLPKVYRGLTT